MSTKRPQMRRSFPFLTIILLALATGCGSNKPVAMESPAPAAQPMRSQAPLHYVVNLNDRADDLFHVTLDVDDLDPSNAVYQFASTAPGTYQVMDIGRFVRSFKAFDQAGAEIPVENISVNQWQISRPVDVTRIEYAVAETWDTPVDEHPIYLMCGTSLENDHALINGQGVFGYPTGMQDRPLQITINRPPSWVVGTALEVDGSGSFVADNYDHVVDSPILLGRLSRASTNVRGTTVDIYTYSKTDHVQSAAILDAVDDILNAAGDFLVDLPVDRYTFLFHFEDATNGAWEHSYSSSYVYAENIFDQAIAESIPNVVAHEFFHIITPLNIHSEIIEQFNFVTPVPSEHLWLYEGTTEWAAHALQLRAGLITVDQYLDRMEQKLRNDDNFDHSFSLSRLAMTSFGDGYPQYANIYQRGALVAGLLDIRLLELSGGSRGLREVLLELSHLYGKNRAFDEKTFFDKFAEITYPEIRQFFDMYVRDAQPLPMEEYYGKLGVAYHDEVATGEIFNGSSFAIGHLQEVGAACGFAAGDEIAAFNGTPLGLANYQQLFGEYQAVPANADYTMTIRRGGNEQDITCQKVEEEKVLKHVLDLEPNPTPEELALREAWMVNLKPS